MIRKFTVLFLLVSACAGVSVALSGERETDGGHAHRRSQELLMIASRELLHELDRAPPKVLAGMKGRTAVLREVLDFFNFQVFPNQQYGSRGDALLAMDYQILPRPKLLIYGAFLAAFDGTSDITFKGNLLEIKRRLLHEAAHLWGWGEFFSEAFAIRMLNQLEGAGMRERRYSNAICSVGDTTTGTADFFSCEQQAVKAYGKNTVEFSFWADEEQMGVIRQKGRIVDADVIDQDRFRPQLQAVIPFDLDREEQDPFYRAPGEFMEQRHLRFIFERASDHHWDDFCLYQINYQNGDADGKTEPDLSWQECVVNAENLYFDKLTSISVDLKFVSGSSFFNRHFEPNW